MRQLISLQIVAPGSFGMNKQDANSLLPPQWATDARNAVIDDAGRLAARDGWTDITTTPITSTPEIEVSHEYRKADGTVVVISAANEKLYTGFDTFTDITGTLTPSASNWQFMNFEDKLIGVQQGETPIVWTGTGNAAAITAGSGSLPTGNCGVSAYGRLWIADSNRKTIKYCGLLDETDWGGAGSGTLIMEQIWDVDEVVGIAAAFNRLIVFGKRNIVVFADSTGSSIGLDPANLYVEDIINGTGLVARDTIQNIGEGDLWYVSPHGLQSMLRVIQEKNNPVVSITDNINRYFVDFVNAESGNIRTCFNRTKGFYLINLPVQTKQFYIDARRQLPDGTYPVTEWNMAGVSSLLYRDNNDMYFGRTNGEYGKYSGNSDGGSSYRFQYKSGWLDMGEDFASFVKVLKKLVSVIFINSAADVTFTLFKDFRTEGTAYTTQLVGDAQAEWGVAEWNIGEWSGGLALREIPVNLGSTAQYIQLSAETDAQSKVSLQQFNLIANRGRMAS